MRTSSRKRFIAVLAVAAVTMLFGGSQLMAQDVANGTATATVVAALTVTASSPLAFGTVYQGVPKSVSKNVAEAAVFDISGQANADLLLYLSLPEFIATASGDDRMVVSFSATDADIDTAIVGAGDPTTFVGGWQGEDPHNLMGVAGADPCLGDAGLCAIFIGGKVIPTLDQTAGAYTGDIILTVAYQGT
ncbi:MAG: hypothetical protein R3F48_07135 [Candidatus Zixiibacteriota bacterium]